MRSGDYIPSIIVMQGSRYGEPMVCRDFFFRCVSEKETTADSYFSDV